VVITEKIDGTNAAVIITDDGEVAAQSRNRIITPAADNFGFARWVADNAAALADLLPVGVHFGEWWGSGIQRGYGLTNGDKRFSLFNVGRHSGLELGAVPGLTTVPVLAEGIFSTSLVHDALVDLQTNGSRAAPGFDRPEGVVVFHSAARQVFKALIENDDQPKGVAA
jgi:hypothetical protein